MAEHRSALLQNACNWVFEKYLYNRTHLLKSLDWVERLAPDASEAVRLATVTHDMERAFGGPDAIPIKMNDRAYEEAHSNRSARIVAEWLRANGAAAELEGEVSGLIRVHEWGGSPDADLVQAADSLSFLETNVDLMIGFAKTGKYAPAVIADKFDQMYERIRVPQARELARPMWQQAKAALALALSRFDYLRPSTLDELFSCLRERPNAVLLSGGTDLIVRIRKGGALPPAVIDLKRIEAISAEVAQTDRCVQIGARAVMADIISSPAVASEFPALVEAASVVGSVQIRNRATLAGNLCNASPAADTAPALLAYRAAVHLISADGRRKMPLDDFFTGPGRTALRGGEIVASIEIPRTDEPVGAAFGRLTRRQGVDLAIASVCCVARRSGDVRFAFGAVGPRPFAVDTRADRPVDDVVAQASPISDLRGGKDYRSAMLPILARRALRTALARLDGTRA
jgi:CO/xanthine dehydrogenase FAD-binding subunit